MRMGWKVGVCQFYLCVVCTNMHRKVSMGYRETNLSCPSEFFPLFLEKFGKTT